MGLFTGIKAMKAIQKIKNGGKAKLSYAMISSVIINLQDAKRKLSSEKYRAIENLYFDFQKCNTLFDVDTEGYLRLCEDVIKKFDAIAPYELYSGGSELEFSMLMDDIRKADRQKSETIHESIADSYEVDEEYIKSLLAGNPIATYEDAVDFYKVLVEAKINGKNAALRKFDAFVDQVAKRNPQNAMLIVPYFCGALYPNGIVSKEESNNLSQKYIQKLFDVAFMK